MKRFVVTGCNGYIGSHMCYELKRAYPGCFIIGIDQVPKKHLSDRLVDKFIRASLGESDTGWMDPVDCVFHFAAYASVPESVERPYAYFKNNIKSTMDIYDMALISNSKSFVFSSTCAVYDAISGWDREFSEVWSTRPMNPYAKSKLMCEQILQSQKFMPVAILRYFNAAGRNVLADLYEEHEPETHLFPILAKETKINVYGTDYNTPDGTAIRDYMHVVDICRAHINAHEYLIETGNNLLCNLGTGKGTSVKEAIDLFEQHHNKKFTVTKCESRKGDVPMLVADNLRMQNVLKFLPRYDIVDIIKSLK